MGTIIIIEVDDKQAIQSLNKLNKSIDNVAKTADKGFGKAGTSLSKFSGGLGTISTGLGGLVIAFGAVAAAGAATFAAIATEGVKLNAEFETSQRVFTNLFDNPQLGKATLDFLRQTSDELRVNQREGVAFAQSILPRTGDVDTFRELLRLVDIQADTTGKSISELEFPIREALSGDFTSLADQFDLGTVGGPTITRLKELGEEIGLDKALVQVLNEEFTKLGKTDISGTLSTNLKDISTSLTNFQVSLGEPIFEEFRKQTEELSGTLGENSDALKLTALQLGDIGQNIVDLIGTGINEYLSNLDFSNLQDLAAAFFELVEKGRLLIDLLFDIGETTPDDNVETLTRIVKSLSTAFNTAAQVVALVKAEFASIAAEINNLSVLFRVLKSNINVFEEGLSVEDVASQFVDSNKAFEDSLKSSLGTIDQSNQRLAKNKDLQKERTEALKEDTAAQKAAIDAALGRKRAAQDLADAQAKAAEAEAEIGEKTAKAEEDRQRKLTDIIRKEAQQRFDDAVKAAQKREDLARDNAQAIEDIFRKNSQDLEDAANDLTRDEQDIARKGARDRHDIERQSANERIDIERNFRRELRRIQDQFNQDAQEAERNNDAQAFLQAVRNRDQQVKVATEDRDTSVEDAASNAQRQREELAISLAAEVEDAKIANARKLEDLQNRLNQELEEQAIKNQRALEEQTINDQRLAEQRALSLQRELEDFARTEAEKQAKLQESLAAQYAAIEEAGQKELALTAQIEAEKTRIVQTETERRRALLAAQAEARDRAKARVKPEDLRPGRSVLGGEQQFASGGRTPVGKPIVVGEQGPEVFVPDSAGTIIPNSAIFSPPASPMGFGGGSSTSITNSPTFNLAESMFSDPIARRNLTNFILSVMAERV